MTSYSLKVNLPPSVSVSTGPLMINRKRLSVTLQADMQKTSAKPAIGAQLNVAGRTAAVAANPALKASVAVGGKVAAAASAPTLKSQVNVAGKLSQIERPVVIAPPIVDPTEATLTELVTYSQPFSEDQVVYIANGIAYPVTNTMLEGVLNLLAVIIHNGVANEQKKVLLTGAAHSNINLLAGRVFLGANGYPTSVQSGNYVPIGHSIGGNEYFFSPRERYVIG